MLQFPMSATRKFLSDRNGDHSRVCDATSSSGGKWESFSTTTRPVMSVTRNTTPGSTGSSAQKDCVNSAPFSSFLKTCCTERSISRSA